MTRLLLRCGAIVAVITALTACSDSGGSPVTSDDSITTAAVESVADEVHVALGVDDRIEVLGVESSACVDGLGQETDDISTVLSSRLADDTVEPSMLDDLGTTLGASDIRKSDVIDPLDGETVIGQRIALFAERDGVGMTVRALVEDGTLTITLRTDCP